jgi:pimeloyl-ACP methyl ester carboxylesterase
MTSHTLLVVSPRRIDIFVKQNGSVITAFFHYKQATLCYHKAGNGSRVLLLFHGYGQHGKIFEEKVKTWHTHYTSYSFDLFFHGESKWGYNENVLTKSFWKELMDAFLKSEGIEQFAMAGFSLGARFVMVTLEAFPTKVTHVHLLAPDGIKTNFWYSLATYPVTLRALFKSMILHPNRFFRLAELIYRMGLVDKGLIRFAESQMKTEEMRKRVYYSWVVFRKMNISLDEITSRIMQHKIYATLIIGSFDKVITLNNMQRLIKRLPSLKVQVLPTGHNGIIERWEAGC